MVCSKYAGKVICSGDKKQRRTTHNIMNCWCRTFVAISKNINHHPSLVFPGHYDRSLHTFSTQSSSQFMTETTPTKKSRIVQLKDLGHTNRDVVEKENVNPSTVSRIYGRYGKTQKFYEKKHRSGRPHKLNDYDIHIALRKLSNGSARNATDLQKKEFPNVSVNTLRRELERRGLNAHIRRKKPLLTPIHKRKRREWALAHGLWQKENWRAVWYSDESKFNLFGSDGQEWCWSLEEAWGGI